MTVVLSAGNAAVSNAPYSATVLPLRGQVPAGSTLRASSDSGLRAAVVAAHTDGSASVVVVSSTATLAAGATAEVPLQVSTAADTPLTAAAISAAISSISVAFGGTYGTATQTNFGSPARVWWASGAGICARYYLPAPTPGSTALEAVIDVHAWPGGRATVEVVLENCKMNSGSPIQPAAGVYAGATVTVNSGSPVSLGAAAGAPEGSHTAFRATYARVDVGWSADLRATQKHTELQQHPMLFRIEQPATADLTIYGADAYSPWSAARQRGINMGGGGDHESIGYLPKWAAQALQSGDRRCWRATEVSDLACLGFDINNRDTLTRLVPSDADVGRNGANWGGSWPRLIVWDPPGDVMKFEVGHHPAAGLMGMLARPSPVFIELAQKVALWVALRADHTQSPRRLKETQVRSQAWYLRSVAHAAFLTPSAMSGWRAGAEAWILGAVNGANLKRNNPRTKLGILIDDANVNEGQFWDHRPHPGFQCSIWQHHFFITAVHAAASTQLMTNGTQQTMLADLADWACLQPVRFINETVNTWAYVSHETTIGNDPVNVGSPDTYGQWAVQTYGAEKPATNTFWTCEDTDIIQGFFQTTTAAPGYNYPRVFNDALHCAIERNVSGASAAWAKLNTAMPQHAQWRAGLGLDPRHGRYARNL